MGLTTPIPLSYYHSMDHKSNNHIVSTTLGFSALDGTPSGVGVVTYGRAGRFAV